MNYTAPKIGSAGMENLFCHKSQTQEERNCINPHFRTRDFLK